ncbi:MAG: ATP synthase subunit alpha [Lentisphaerae bacterium ADurb.BinA184]|nr:MAG: ATP synthase subunit alpha [Lentisphaerae bacterium ADurb.BinA184]
MALDRIQIREVGEVREIRKDIAKVTGLGRCMNGEMLDFTPHARGMVVGFDEQAADVVLLGRVEDVRVGSRALSRLEPFSMPAGDGYLGRIVNALALPLDGGPEIGPDAFVPLFREAPGVLDRVPISRVFETGILSIDSTIPIGRGQRELIIGDRMTGKTTIAVDAILNQRGKDVVCIYCCIGRAYSSLRRVVETLKFRGALDYTIVVAATGSVCSGEQYLAPYTAAALGEHFMDAGRDVFIVFDDLTKHAWAYRQMSLLLERPPGRECYPGDIFYLHSQLMERAGQMTPELGGGSMTFFPIVDTLQGDVTGFIPSNLISMTDGQIYMDTTLFNSGFRPAIDLSLSVSRIGNKVQTPVMRRLSAMLRLEYVQYHEMLKKTRFTAAVSDDQRERLRPGEVLTQLFTQDGNSPYPIATQLCFLYALRERLLDKFGTAHIQRFKHEFINFLRQHSPDLIGVLEHQGELTPDHKAHLAECLDRFYEQTVGDL